MRAPTSLWKARQYSTFYTICTLKAEFLPNSTRIIPTKDYALLLHFLVSVHLSNCYRFNFSLGYESFPG